jgi:hypothetical protein
MSVPPALIGTISRMQTSSVGSMLSSVGSRMRPWTTDFGASLFMPVASVVCFWCSFPDTLSHLRRASRSTAAVSQFAKPGDDWSKRLQVNLTYYKGNYSAIFLVFVLYSIIANPFLLTSIVILTGAWTFLLHGRPRTEDGSLVPVSIGGRVFTGVEQKAGLGVRLVGAVLASRNRRAMRQYTLAGSRGILAADAATQPTQVPRRACLRRVCTQACKPACVKSTCRCYLHPTP